MVGFKLNYFALRLQSPDTPYIDWQVGLRTCLGVVAKKIIMPCWESNPGRQEYSLVIFWIWIFFNRWKNYLHMTFSSLSLGWPVLLALTIPLIVRQFTSESVRLSPQAEGNVFLQIEGMYLQCVRNQYTDILCLSSYLWAIFWGITLRIICRISPFGLLRKRNWDRRWETSALPGRFFSLQECRPAGL